MEPYDIFLSHANADKLDFVEDLKKSFDKLGIKVFYDKDSIEWGDKWKDRILDGLKNCKFGVIVVSENFFDREWTEKELKELLSRQKSSGQKLILPIIHNISAEMLYKKYRKLSEIQFLDSSKLDIKDITIQLARILLKEQQNAEQSENNNSIFVEFFKHMHSVDFYHWVNVLIQNNNEWCDGYDTELIGWDLLKINDEYIPLIQSRKNESQNSNMFGYGFGDSDDYQYRINPIYYDDFCKYFDKYIRPQM